MLNFFKKLFKASHVLHPLKTLLIIGVIVTSVSSNLHWGQDHWKNILEADAKGYYAYLPATFIYHDLNFGFFDKIEKETYYNPNLFYDYRSFAHGKIINKYYCGTAICQLPFFGIAHILSPYMGFEQDGYSKLYLIMVNVAAIFYLLLGLFFADKVLQKRQISANVRAIVLLAFTLGTNLFYYTIGECGMSHVYSFALISLFVYLLQGYFEDGKWMNLNAAFALAGLIVLVRPVNGLVVLSAVFVAGNGDVLKNKFLHVVKHIGKIVPGLFVGLLFPLLQIIIYKVSTGHFVVYSYINEGFNFSQPHILDFLISYKKGMFVYTPMLLLSIVGCYLLYKKSKFEGWSFVLFLLVVLYVLSSWWNWWYGGSFSSRVMIDYYIFFMMALASLIQAATSKLSRRLLIGLVIAITLFTQIQTYQYRYYKIHWEEQTKDRYWSEFMRIDKL